MLLLVQLLGVTGSYQQEKDLWGTGATMEHLQQLRMSDKRKWRVIHIRGKPAKHQTDSYPAKCMTIGESWRVVVGWKQHKPGGKTYKADLYCHTRFTLKVTLSYHIQKWRTCLGHYWNRCLLTISNHFHSWSLQHAIYIPGHSQYFSNWAVCPHVWGVQLNKGPKL